MAPNRPLVVKKSIAIFFLVIFLFNVGGYYLVFWGLQSRAKTNLMHRLDADAYSSDEVVILTLPVSLPYPIHEARYERADGEVEYKGEFYRLVKQKVENDTLFMVCIKDRQQKKLQRAMNDYVKLANSLPTSTKHTLDLLGKLYKDFTKSSDTILSLGEGWSAKILFRENNFSLLQQVYPVDSPPPELS
jgi:hypothetical protein